MSQDRYVGPLVDRINEWADGLITPYIETHPVPPNERKQIHDPLDRIIELESWEVYIVDSPLFQRLRYIRQLGVGHFLFPTAGYSRFEHSLGAMQTASLMFDSVFAALSQSEGGVGPAHGTDVLRRQRATIRLAALVHDIGHCVFSHVSERVYQNNADLSSAQSHFKDIFQQGNISASETISLLILQSPAFLRLLRAARPRHIPNEEQAVSQMMMCIAGSVSRIAPNSYMAEIVNGSVDCDKLDYLARDAHMAGVPIPLDITRLLSKLRIAVKKKQGEEDKWALAIVPSGMRALDELQVARIFLFDKFYYHQKVMAAEELIRRALRYLSASVLTLSDPAVLLEFGDDEFLALTPNAIASRFTCDIDDNIKRGCELLKRVRNRDLPKRAFAMANRFIPDPPALLALFHAEGRPTTAKERNVDFFQMSQQLNSPAIIEQYRAQIADYAKELGTETEVYVAHQVAGRAASSMYLPVLRSDNRLDERPKYLFANDYWTEAYASNKATSYVFADNPSADVFLGAERFISGKWDLFFDRSCWVTAKMSEDLIEAKRRSLPPSWTGYRLPPDFLDRPAARAEIEKLNEKFSSFLSAFHSSHGRQLIEAWLAQFPDSDLQESALRLLKHITFVGPDMLEAAFGNFAKGDKTLSSAIWTPFRAQKGPGESADQLAVDLKEITVRNQPVHALDPTEIRAAGAVVFYDDTLNSGIQSACRLLSWFGGAKEECEHPEDWDKTGPLPLEVQKALREVRVIFAVYAKHPTGDSRVRKTAHSLGLDLLDIYGVINSGLPDYTLEGLKLASNASNQRFISYLTNVGQNILRPKIGKPGWTEERVSGSALGYSGIPLTVVFRHSISASSPVALWGMSLDYDQPWMPVFPRDKKALRNVLNGKKPDYDEKLEPLEEYEGR
jgi:HD superfamily phosphohydrolase